MAVANPGLSPGLERRLETDAGLSEAHLVAVAQHAPALDPLAVEVGPVAGEPVVDQDPLVAHPLQAGVDAGDVLIPGEDDIGSQAAADCDLAPAVRQGDDALALAGVAEDEVGIPLTLGCGAVVCLCVGRHDPIGPRDGRSGKPLRSLRSW